MKPAPELLSQLLISVTSTSPLPCGAEGVRKCEKVVYRLECIKGFALYFYLQ
jgi:hypothetical protein